jgi:hypothetical protein
MSLISKMRRQTAVYWARTGTNDRGRAVFDNPVELRVRWDGVVEEFVSPDGRTGLSHAKVYVGEDVTLGGILWLGTLADLTDAQEAAPLTITGAYEIRRFDTIPNMKATEFLRIATL